MRPFELSNMTDEQRSWILEALSRTQFNFQLLIPGLEAQVNRNVIPVEFIDLSRWALRVEDPSTSHQHGHGHFHGDEGHTIERELDGRRRVLGLAWYSGKVSLEKTLGKDLAMEVFLAEGAHMVDFFYMTPTMREEIFATYHTGDPTPHDHGWFEETGNDNYWSWVGESFMYGFTMAFSDVSVTGDAFLHRTTPEIAARVRAILDPPHEYARNRRSSIIHRMKGWHERQIRDDEQVTYRTREEATAEGRRLCKTCNWKNLT